MNQPEKTKANYAEFITQINDAAFSAVLFENREFDDPLRLNFGKLFSINKPVTFKSCTFTEVEFVSIIFTSIVYFHDCEVSGDFGITTCHFKNRFMTTGLYAQRIAIWKNDFDLGVLMKGYVSYSDATFQFNKLKGHVELEQSRITRVEVGTTNIQFENCREASFGLSDIWSKKIQILFHGPLLSNSIAGIEADTLELMYLVNKSDSGTSIERIKVNEFVLFCCKNDGNMNIKYLNRRNKNADSMFQIQDSYLGNCEWYHVDLAAFDKIMIYNSHLQKIIPVGVLWNFKRKAYTGVKEDYLRELFRQFKNICSTNMDKVSQLRFEQLEMYYYAKQLSWKKHFGDWLIFKTNKYSNNFGQSWILPFLWLLGTSGVNYVLVNYSSGYFSCLHVGNYLNFILPIHNLKEVICITDANVINGWTRFWDVLERVLSSYFIFQFLRAFRKYVN